MVFAPRSVLRGIATLLTATSCSLSAGALWRLWRDGTWFHGVGMVFACLPVLLSGSAVVLAASGHSVPLAAITLVLVLFTFVTGFSIGGSYVPAVALLVVAMFVALIEEGTR